MFVPIGSPFLIKSKPHKKATTIVAWQMINTNICHIPFDTTSEYITQIPGTTDAKWNLFFTQVGHTSKAHSSASCFPRDNLID